MEQVTQAVSDELVASLDYKLATGNTNYVQSRKSVQYYPSSLSTFTPSTSRVCRIPITSGMDFVDPESVKLAFTFTNTDGSSDMLCGSPDPSCFIERIQLFANGQRVEDISYYGRSAFMYSLLRNDEWWKGRLWEGLPVDAGGWALPVQPGQKRDVLMAPHLIGMFNCGKMLPPQLNLVLEIEFAEPGMAMRAGVGSSLSYQIENVHLLADQVTLDSALRESFERILLSNRSLPGLQLPEPARAAVHDPGGSHELQHYGGPRFHETPGRLRDLQQNGREPRVQLRVSRRSLPQRHGGHRHGGSASARGSTIS